MRRVLTVAIVLVAALLGVPSVASASSTTSEYVALGDSYSSGVGTRVYFPSSATCARSPLAYPSLFRAAHHVSNFTFAACSGATIADVADQLGAVTRRTDLVTLTAGGNDVGFGTVLAACSGPPTAPDRCQAAVEAGQGDIEGIPAKFTGVLDQIRARASTRARIIVLGYPRLFGEGPCTAAGLPVPRIRSAIDDGVDQLNLAVEEAVEANGASFVDVTDRFARHGSCAEPRSQWINPPTTPSGESYHPNVRGHAFGYLLALDAALRHPASAAS